ncbi:helix-turn-helix domain-containing protein [Caldiplasma sukawensis]
MSEYIEKPIFVMLANNVEKRNNLVVGISETNIKKFEYSYNDFMWMKSTSEGKFTVSLMLKKGHGIVRGIVENMSFLIYPVLINDGREKVNFISIDKEDAENALRAIEMRNSVDYCDIRRIEKGKGIESILFHHGIDRGLTETQKLILREAYRRGYYSWPRKIELEELANTFRIKKPTALYHLRKGEKKILDSFFGTDDLSS